MLAKILDYLSGSDGLLDLRQLSRELGVEESALRGMLDYLVRKEYLREEHCVSGQSCKGCYRGCVSPGSPHLPDERGKPIGYTLTEKAMNRG